MLPLLAWWSIARPPYSQRGMSFFRARQRALGTADRRSAIVYRAWTMPGQWGSTSFIFRRFIRLVTRIAKAETTRSPASRVIRACRGRSVAKPADTKPSILRLGRWPISIGFKKRCANAEWKLRWISPSIARQIILTSKGIPIGSTNGRTARLSTRRIRRKNTRTFIR